jgi:hypothetical protein
LSSKAEKDVVKRFTDLREYAMKIIEKRIQAYLDNTEGMMK